MATKKQNDVKATENKTPAEAFDEEGWDNLGTPEIDAWWHVSANAVLQGNVCGRIFIRDEQSDDGKREVILVRLTKPAAGVKGGESTPTEYPEGSVFGMTLRHRLAPLRECVRNECLVRVTALEEKKIKGGRTMWAFDIRSKGKRELPPPIMTMDAGAPKTDADGFEDASQPLS